MFLNVMPLIHQIDFHLKDIQGILLLHIPCIPEHYEQYLEL